MVRLCHPAAARRTKPARQTLDRRRVSRFLTAIPVRCLLLDILDIQHISIVYVRIYTRAYIRGGVRAPAHITRTLEFGEIVCRAWHFRLCLDYTQCYSVDSPCRDSVEALPSVEPPPRRGAGRAADATHAAEAPPPAGDAPPARNRLHFAADALHSCQRPGTVGDRNLLFCRRGVHPTPDISFP